MFQQNKHLPIFFANNQLPIISYLWAFEENFECDWEIGWNWLKYSLEQNNKRADKNVDALFHVLTT